MGQQLDAINFSRLVETQYDVVRAESAVHGTAPAMYRGAMCVQLAGRKAGVLI